MAVFVHNVHDVRSGEHWLRYDLTPELSISVHDDGRIHVHSRIARYRLAKPLCGQGVDLIPEDD